jgi:hypothetical protein
VSPSRLSITGVLAGTTLGATVLLPGTALAHPVATAAGQAGSAAGQAGSATGRAGSSDRDRPGDSRPADDGSDPGRPAAHRHTRHHGHSRHHVARPRPMTSGERQYRNGCRQGYILDGCAQFDVPHLLRRGISPFG